MSFRSNLSLSCQFSSFANIPRTSANFHLILFNKYNLLKIYSITIIGNLQDLVTVYLLNRKTETVQAIVQSACDTCRPSSTFYYVEHAPRTVGEIKVYTGSGLRNAGFQPQQQQLKRDPWMTLPT